MNSFPAPSHLLWPTRRESVEFESSMANWRTVYHLTRDWCWTSRANRNDNYYGDHNDVCCINWHSPPPLSSSSICLMFLSYQAQACAHSMVDNGLTESSLFAYHGGQSSYEATRVIWAQNDFAANHIVSTLVATRLVLYLLLLSQLTIGAEVNCVCSV